MTKRSENRNREHADHTDADGNHWRPERAAEGLPILDGVPCLLMRCPCGWLGWMPSADVALPDADAD